ncbi:complement component 7b [Lampris incognitus]|uniref:complement component 7b n=1 Tax=Lampris incognitus TaxID=2546036 RepID=UPI0024B62CB3|nr:complement component 7b [Lampris incognitus]
MGGVMCDSNKSKDTDLCSKLEEAEVEEVEVGAHFLQGGVSVISSALRHQVTLALAVSCLPLLAGFIRPGSGAQAVSCRWRPYGGWSECDGCTRQKVRLRHVEVHAQYGGAPCSGGASQTQPCVPQRGCPLETGCGGRFRCTSGQCISQSLVCNGDQDCEDGLDERGCSQDSSHYVCDTDKTPPNSDVTGRGYDVLTGQLRAGVINTLSFGGQCRKVFSGDHRTYYRLPQSVLRYNFEVRVDNQDSDESYESSWSYVQHIQSDSLIGQDRRTFHKELTQSQTQKLLILKNQVELAQFQNSAPQYLTLSEGFWKALSSLPLTYDYPAYRRVLQTYGTHYMSAGSLGGQYQALLEVDQQALDSTSTTDIEYQRCWRKVKRRWFRKKVTTTCEKLTKAFASRHGKSNTKITPKTRVVGGDLAFIAALNVLDVDNPEANGANYDAWASSVKDFPDVINQQLRPLYELVKEVQCAGLRKLLLKRATEEYLAEEHPCHCRPCENNGRPLLSGTECTCICRPGTFGEACERGAVIGEQPGVTDGGWTCWSSWSSCSGGQMSRTRSCTNPAPRRGGLHCPGLGVERKPCEDPDIPYLQMMEPQCFSLSVSPPKTCGAPPNLRNGFVLNPRDVYSVGSRIEYSCISGYYLKGEAMAQCADNQLWTTAAMTCESSTCGLPSLNSDVIGAPTKVAYDIGDRVSLSCPVGSVLEGDLSEIICSPSLQWSPSPEGARCTEALSAPPQPAALACKPWEDPGKTQCVCKTPHQCPPSLQLCARLGPSRTRLLGLCQVGALQCLGRRLTLASDGDCDWPANTATCETCSPGETCRAGKCVCLQPKDCSADSAHLCVIPEDEDAPVSMSECEVGARRCGGEQLTVVGIEACPH